MGVRIGSIVVSVAVLICLGLVVEQVEKSAARKFPLLLSFFVCILADADKLLFLKFSFHFLSVKCYECPQGPGIKARDCPNNRKGNLVSCTDKDPLCFSRVKRQQEGHSNPAQEVDSSWVKGCVGRDGVDPGRNNIDGNTLGCRVVTNLSDYCICNKDRCNVDDHWPKRGEPYNPNSK